MANSITTSVKFFLRPSTNEGLNTVCIRVKHHNRRNLWALRDIRVTDGDFRKINIPGKRLSPELTDLRLKLDKLKSEAQTIITDLGKDFTFEAFTDLFFGKKQILSRQAKFSDIIDEYISTKPLSINTKNGYRAMLSNVSKLYPKLTIGDLSSNVINTFRLHLKDQISLSSITIYLRYIKAVWNYSASKGWVNKDNSPFTGVKLPSTLKRKRALVREQLRMIKNYVTNDARTQRAIDFFFISYYSNGINFKDLLHLKSTNIKDGYIEFFRAKTRNSVSRSQQTIQVSIEPQLQGLIDKWAKLGLTKEDYIFPFIDDTMSESKRQRVVDQFIQNTNKHLDIVGKKLDLPLKLTTYVARHSFASRIALSSLNPFVVKELLGHATVQQSETYISTLDTSVSRIAAKLVADI